MTFSTEGGGGRLPAIRHVAEHTNKTFLPVTTESNLITH